ncbi:MAG: glutamate ligase domain-containing protein, partial [Opitutaceae bacterium]
MRPPEAPSFFGLRAPRVHCVGAGGMGVGPLAVHLAGLGLSVTGEDDALAPEMAAQLAGAGVGVGPLPAACEILVHSSAIGPRHPARAAAAARGIAAVRRGEMLAEAVRGRRLVAVCGAHGKTTTTAMLIAALRAAGFPAGFILGGLFADGSAPARAGSNEWVVAEIDESDGTIDGFSPEITVAVSLDWDHPDFYRTAADLEAAFAGLFARTRAAVLVSDTCPRSLRLAARAAPGGPEYAVFGRTGEFSATIASEAAGRMTLALGGRFPAISAVVRAQGEFNAANAAAALAALQLMGVAPAPRALAEYPGVRRRQAILSGEGGVTVLEDYAHHPTEIRALLTSLRGRVAKGGRLMVVFQPHRYSRTARFAAEFAAALALADRVHLLDVYGAGEAPLPGGTSADIYAEMKRTHGALAASYLPGGRGMGEALAEEIRAGDLVAFVGAGDIERHAREWLQ